jgi:hypothetical protein
MSPKSKAVKDSAELMFGFRSDSVLGNKIFLTRRISR